MPDVRRILLVRLDGLGDALVCVPALESLRRALPIAEFGALCTSRNASLFERSRVSRIHVLDDEAGEIAMAAELRAAGYTDALVATEEPIGYRLARASGAQRRSGFWHRFEKPLKSLWQRTQLTDAVYRPAAWVEAPEHEVNALHRLALRLGAAGAAPGDPTALRAWLDVAPPDAAATADAMAFQLASKWLAHGWDARAIAALARIALRASPHRRCVLLGGPYDAGLARDVMEQVGAASDEGSIVLAPPAALPLWLRDISAASVLVTPDTGAAHAAGMLGVPVVDVFEEERFAQLSRQWRPWAAPSRCLARPEYIAGAETAFGARVGAALTELVAIAGAAS